jgi:hypothetical protein
MKKIIILAIATLSTGIVLSSNMKKNETVKPVSLSIQKNVIIQAKTATAPSYDMVANAD